MMNKRKLGKTGMEISPLVFGGNIFGWTVDQTTSFKLLDAFVAAGFNSVDTADMYSKWVPGHAGGESEKILGEWMKRSGNRSKIIVATKVGMEMGDGKKGLSKSYILRAAEDSLRRLQTDYIDLYQSHTDDAETPLEETLAAYADLIKQGKVRAIGASNFKAERLAAALETSKKIRIAGVSDSSAQLQPYRARGVREHPGTALPKRRAGRHQLFSIGRRISHRQISFGSRPGGKSPGAQCYQVSQRARLQNSRRPRSGRKEIQRHSRQDFSRLAAGAPQHHRAHRERDKSGAAERFGFFG